MKLRTIVSGSMIGLFALSSAGVAFAGVDQYAESTKTCESVINSDVKREFREAKSIEWDWGSITERKSKNTVTLRGQGSYKGKSGKGRTFDFECEYDTDKERVSSGWWQSSFDGKRHAVDSTGGSSYSPGPSESDVTRACKEAVTDEIRSDFEHGVRSLELIEDSIDRSESHGTHTLKGQGRFEGGGGDWRRFDFTCTYDDYDGDVTNVTWRHLGDEKDLD